MPSLLHVVNGDATVARLQPLSLQGDVLVWRDILVEGPVTAGVGIESLATWRAPWLAQRFGIAEDAYAATGAAEARGLATAASHDEVVLWFEQDLFCVANLAFLADWIERTRPTAKISLIFPAAPLGESDTAMLAALFAHRRPFDGLEVAASWWRGFCAADPRALEETPATVPFLDRARNLHFSRFPDVMTGLGAVEAAVLGALAAESEPFDTLFRAVTQDATMRGLGMGDVQLAGHMAALATGPTPLVTIDGAPGITEAAFRTWRIGITETGRAVRRGALDRFDAQPLDWWLGGVHIEGRDSAWRWDAAAREVRPR
jgi:hypothetical protein